MTSQLLSQLAEKEVTDYVIFEPNGEVVEIGGFFVDALQKREAAFMVVQQCSAIMKPTEKLKRVTIAFEDATYIATVTTINGKPYGVVVCRPNAPA